MTNQNTVEQIKQLELDTLSAQRWANEGNIEQWVHKFLLSGTGGPTNSAFSDGLKLEKRWWNGPIEFRLDQLSPAVGTDPNMEYVVSKDDWHLWTSNLAETFTTLPALPPLILEYRDGELSIRDGNTRHGAMKRLGWPTCWAIIWYNSEADYLKHSKLLGLAV